MTFLNHRRLVVRIRRAKCMREYSSSGITDTFQPGNFLAIHDTLAWWKSHIAVSKLQCGGSFRITRIQRVRRGSRWPPSSHFILYALDARFVLVVWQTTRLRFRNEVRHSKARLDRTVGLQSSMVNDPATQCSCRCTASRVVLKRAGCYPVFCSMYEWRCVLLTLERHAVASLLITS